MLNTLPADYVPSESEEYMNSMQLQYFEQILLKINFHALIIFLMFSNMENVSPTANNFLKSTPRKHANLW